MKKFTLPMILTAVLMVISSTSIANDQPATYSSKVGNKALNGFTNMTTAILEIPKNVINTTNDSNIIYGIGGGLIKGMINTAGRVATGVFDLITAPLPTKPVQKPVLIWDDFDEDTTYGEVFRLDE